MQQPSPYATNRRVGCIMWLAIAAIVMSAFSLIVDATQELAWNGRIAQLNELYAGIYTTPEPIAQALAEETQIAEPLTPTVQPATVPDATAPTPRMGETVVQDGYSLMVIGVENPSLRPTTFYKSRPGMKLIAIEAVVGNVSAEQFSSNVLYGVVTDNNGFLYGAETVIVEQQIELLDVNPGEVVRGWFGFVIPENATPVSFKYDFDMRGDVIQISLN